MQCEVNTSVHYWMSIFIVNVYMLYLRLGGPYGETVTEGLKMPPEAAGRGQHFQARGHSFSPYEPTLSRQITFLFFFLH